MSGRKHTSISLIDVLRGFSVVQQHFRNKQAERSRNHVNTQAQHERERQKRETENRHAAYQRQIENLKHDQRHLAQELNRNAKEKQKQFENSLNAFRRSQEQAFENHYEQMQNNIRQAQENFDGKLDALENSFEQRFQNQAKQIKADFNEQRRIFMSALDNQAKHLQSQISELQKTANAEQEAAENWLETSSSLIEHVQAQYRHEMFLPGEIDKINKRLLLAQQNYKNGLHASAIPIAQETFLQLSLLREQLEIYQQEWEEKQIIAKQSLNKALSTVEQYRKFDLVLPKTDVQGSTEEPGSHEIDMDYWTQGALTQLEEQLIKKRDLITTDDCQASIDELNNIIDDAASALTKIACLAVQAESEFVSSVYRTDMMRDFYEKLHSSGYQLVDNVWYKDDVRNSNHLVLRGVNGDEICLVLVPKRDEGAVVNELQVNFKDNSPNEVVRKERLKALQSVLTEIYQLPGDTGFKAMPGEDFNSNADDRLFDTQRIKKGLLDGQT